MSKVLGTSADIQARLEPLTEDGGRLLLENGTYQIKDPIEINSLSTKLAGEVWCCNTDPNGVFESNFGTKLRLVGTDHPAITVAPHNMVGGNVICDLGIQGDIKGMDSRRVWNSEHPEYSAGIHFSGCRVDQAEFSKISFCGLSSAICATGTSEIDACVFEKLNMDGCCVGVYFAPLYSYYARFRHCVFGDTPSYAFYASCEKMHNLELTDSHFVRNCGAMPGGNTSDAAAVYFNGISTSTIRNCLFDAPGTFWYYDDDATQNSQRQPSKVPVVALRVTGRRNRIIDNVFIHSSAESIVLSGNENVLLNNIVDGDVVVEGDGNMICNLVFTKPEARLILQKNATNTQITGVPEDRIVRL